MFRAILIDIKRNILFSKFKLSILCITQVVAVLCVFTAYGIASNLFIEKAEQTTLNTTFFISLFREEAEELVYDEITYSEFDQKIKAVLNSSENLWKSVSSYGYVLCNNEKRSFAALDPNLYYEYEASPNQFTEQDFRTNNNVISVNSEALPYSPGDTVTIGSRNYTVKASNKNFAADIIIPYNSLTDDFLISRFDLFLGDIPTQNEISVISNKIRESFGYDLGMDVPQVPDLIENQFNNSTLLITILVGIIVLVNFGYLYDYILYTQSNVAALYKNVGCTKDKMIGIFITEFSIIGILMLPISLAIFFKLLRPFLANYYDVLNSVYTHKAVAYLVLGYIIADILIKLLKINLYVILITN